MTIDRKSHTRQFFIQLALIAVIGLWGVVALANSLRNVNAQDPAAQPQPQPQPAAAGTRIAYINLEKVVRDYPKWWVKYEALRKESTERENKLKETEAELQALKRSIESGDDISKEKFESFMTRTRIFELEKRKAKADLEREMRDLSTAVYSDMYDMVESFTKSKYDLVLGISERDILTGTQGEFFQKMTVRAVVIHDPTSDITAEVTMRLQVKALNEGTCTLKELNDYRKKVDPAAKPLKRVGDRLVEDNAAGGTPPPANGNENR